MSLETLTPTEAKLLANAWQCIQGQPNVDMDKLADIMGHTNKRTTSNMMGIVRKKLAAAEGGIIALPGAATTNSAKSSPAAKVTPRKRKAVVNEYEGDLGDGEEPEDSPAAKKAKVANGPGRKKARAPKTAIKREEELFEEQSEQPEEEQAGAPDQEPEATPELGAGSLDELDTA